MFFLRSECTLHVKPWAIIQVSEQIIHVSWIRLCPHSLPTYLYFQACMLSVQWRLLGCSEVTNIVQQWSLVSSIVGAIFKYIHGGHLDTPIYAWGLWNKRAGTLMDRHIPLPKETESDCGGRASSEIVVGSGVLQGTVLGPILFLLYNWLTCICGLPCQTVC